MAMDGDINQPQQGHPKLLRIGSRRFAFGLFWQSGGDAKQIDAEAREFAQTKNINADLYVVRRLAGNARAQFGVGRRAEKLTRGAVAAAAVAADTLRHSSWIGVFAVHNGFWMVMVHDNYILPDGDIFFEKEEWAKERFAKELHGSNWAKVYAPAHWAADFDEFEEVNIAELLGGARFRGLRLNDINPLRSKLPYLVVGVLGAGLVFGGVYYYKSVQEAERQAAIEQQLQAQEQLKKITQPPTKVTILPPWHDEPDAGQLFLRCRKDIASLPLNIPGYDLVELGCTRNSYFGNYNRDGGVAAWFERWLGPRAAENWTYDISPDGETLSINVPSENILPRGETPLASRYEVTKSMVERAQTLDDILTLGTPQQPAPPPGTDPENWNPPSFAPMEFRIETSQPAMWQEQLDRTPGTVISTVTYTRNRSNWTVKGEVYVNR